MERALDLLPYYTCGLIWTIDVIIIIALRTRLSDAVDAAQTLAKLINPFNFPDVTVGFLLAVGGVLFPYALARAVTPITAAVFNTVTPYMRTKPSYELTGDQWALATKRMKELFGIDPPNSAWSDVLWPFLLHVESSTTDGLETRLAELYEKTNLIFPISILTGLLLEITLGRSVGAVVVGLAATVVLLVTLIYRVHIAFIIWGEDVVLAFLVVSARAISSTAQGDGAKASAAFDAGNSSSSSATET